ncbi:helix-turn-helix transcriptional regulator [Rhodopirellula sp. SWK7]|uniref:helix-turn-helix transcriptional regulator n=1 Tax=Rhodopirellula sp. SWK7 TaxID=595460 RepID=UPI0002BFA6E7|nr:hypothetical protein RRSWK_02479 [Rhodopirellula sp. SWK7]
MFCGMRAATEALRLHFTRGQAEFLIMKRSATRSTATASKETGKEQPARETSALNVAKGAAEKSTGKSESPASRWTFLTNHAHVLITLHGDPDLVLREVALKVGITERAVQRIVQDLEDEGFIRREKVGRKNHYEVLPDEQLRHPIEAHRTIGDLLKLIHG